MMDKKTLHSAIKDAAEGFIKKHKTESVSVATYKLENGQIVSGDPQVTKEIPSGDAGIKAVIDIIAEAVAQEVITHIQTYLELQQGSFTLSNGSINGLLSGVGGGVPGPVQVTGGSIITETGTVDITKGTFK